MRPSPENKNGIKTQDRESTAVLLILAAGVALSCLTLFAGYDILPDYQDKLVHLRRIAALSDTLKSGYFPARIYFVMNEGTGYAMPVFYPDIFLYIPSLLYGLGVPLTVTYDIYVVLMNVTTATVTYFSVKAFTGGRRIVSSVAAFIYLLSVYRLTDVYIRDAAGEYTAMAFLPFAIYGFWNVYTSGSGRDEHGEGSAERSGDIFHSGCILGLGMFLLLSSHILTTLMTVMLMGLCAVICIRKTLEKRIFLSLLVSVFVFALLSAFILVPMLDYMMADDYLVDVSSSVMRGFYPGWRELLELIPGGSGSGIAYELRMPTAVGASVTAVLLAWAFYKAAELAVCIKAGRTKEFFSEKTVTGILFFVFTGITLFVSSKYFPWTYIESRQDALTKIFCSVQFSWRYIGIATALSVFTGAELLAEVSDRKNSFGRALCVLLIILSVIPGAVLQLRASEENRRAFITYGEEIGIVSDELYFPVSWNRDADYERVPESYGSVSVNGFGISDHKWKVSVSAGDEGGMLIFPLVSYKGYAAEGPSGNRLEILSTPDGRAAAVIPAGFSGEISLRFIEPYYWRLSELISPAAFVLAAVFLCRGRSKAQKHIRRK